MVCRFKETETILKPTQLDKNTDVRKRILKACMSSSVIYSSFQFTAWFSQNQNSKYVAMMLENTWIQNLTVTMVKNKDPPPRPPPQPKINKLSSVLSEIDEG